MPKNLSGSINLFRTKEFGGWFSGLPDKTQLIVNARLQRIENEGHFGTINSFDGLIELKWKSGLRVYTHRHEATLIIVLLGGNKNGQSKDIRQAQKILKSIQKNGFDEA